MDILKHVGTKIRELRLESAMSQEDLADGLGVATNTISRWETSTYKPSIEDLDKLSRLLKVSILEFFPSGNEADKASRLHTLLRAAEKLDENDIDELQRYAEFRRARHMYSKPINKRRVNQKDAAQ